MKTYYEDGSVMEEYLLNNEKKNGPYMHFYPNGTIWSEGHFYNDRMDGVWHNYYENGEILSIVKYDKGELANLNAWDQDSIQTIKDCNSIAIWKYPDKTNRSQVSYKNCKPHGLWIM